MQGHPGREVSHRGQFVSYPKRRTSVTVICLCPTAEHDVTIRQDAGLTGDRRATGRLYSLLRTAAS